MKPRKNGELPSVGRCAARNVRLVSILVAAACQFHAASAQVTLEEQLQTFIEEHDDPALIEAATRLRQQRPGDEQLLFALVGAQIRTDDLARAEKTLTEWQALQPKSALAFEARGDLQLAQEKPKEAILSWTEALKSADPKRVAELWRKVAQAQFGSADYAAAAAAWKSAYEADPQASDLINRAEALVHEEQFPKAVAAAKEAAELAPDDPSVKNNLPRFERLEKAIPLITPLLVQPESKTTDFVLARTQAGILLGVIGFPPAGLPYAEAALAKNTEAFSPTLVTGYLLRANAMPDKAADLGIRESLPPQDKLPPFLRLIENIHDEDRLFVQQKATAESWIKQLERVRSLREPWFGATRAEKALALYPNNAKLLSLYAWFLWESQTEGALAAADAALEADPKLGSAWLLKAVILEKSGDLSGALAAYRKSAEFNRDRDSIENVNRLERLLEVQPSTPPSLKSDKKKKVK